MQREKSARFCKAHLGFHSHQTVGWGVSTFGRQRWVSFALLNSHLMDCEMGRSFLGLVSQPCPMGKEQELEERSPQVSTKAGFTPASFYTLHFASQSSSQSVTKYRGITNSRNGSLSPFCEKLLLQRWHEGLKSPEPSVLSTSGAPEASPVTLAPRRRALDPTSGSEDNVAWWFLMQTISHTESCQAFYGVAPMSPIELKTTEAPCGRHCRWINRTNRGELSTAERKSSDSPSFSYPG